MKHDAVNVVPGRRRVRAGLDLSRFSIFDFDIFKFNIFQAITLGFALIALVAAFVLLAAPRVPDRLQETGRQVAHTHEALAGLETILSTLEDAESGQRGFLLTGDALYLKRYQAAQARVERELDRAQALTADNPPQQERVGVLRARVALRINSLARTLAAAQTGGLQKAIDRIRAGQGDREMQQARGLLADIEREERRLLARRLSAWNAEADTAKKLFGSGLLTIALLLGTLYALLRHDVRLRRRQADREREQNAQSTAIVESISDAFVAFDYDWRFIYVNHEAERMIGRPRAEMLGGNIWEMFPGLQDSDLGVEYHRAMKERTACHFQTYYPPTECWYEAHVYPSAQGITAYFRDITERILSDERFRVLFEQSSDAHLLVGEQGIIDCNQATIAMLGCADKAQILSLHPAVLSPEFQPDGQRSLERAMEIDALAREQGHHRFEWTHLKTDGTPFPVEVTITPVTLAGKPVLLSVLHDLTERKRAETRAHTQYSVTRILSEAESLETAAPLMIQAVCQGMEWDWGAIWRVDEHANLLRCVSAWHTPDLLADEFLEDTSALTFAPGMGLPGRVWLKYEPEWIADVTQDMTFLRADVAMRNDLHTAVAFPIRFEGAVVGVMELLSRQTLAEDMSQMLQLNALGSQIGQFIRRKQAEEALQEAKRFSDSIAQQSTSLIYVFDMETLTNVYVNQELTEFLGYTLGQTQALEKQFIPSIVHPDDLPFMRAHLSDFAAMSDGETLEFETRIKHASGEWRWIWFRERVFKRRADGMPYQIMGTAQDVTERKRNEQQLQAANEWLEEANEHLGNLANTDGLTGLNNHRVFQQRLAEEFERSARYQTPLSLLLLDVDRFKQYNDTFGHPAGDAVLKQVAQILQTTARGVDVVARYGGEEFVIVLPEADTEGALAAAERVRAAIAAADWPRRAITASVGVATFTLNTPTQAVLIEQADKALYASKTAGRNRVTHHNALHDLALAVERMA